MTDRTEIAQILDLVRAGALFVVNHSGGKDSQAMCAKVRNLVPASQILVIHADLSEVEYRGTLEHVVANIGDLPLVVARAASSFFDMVERRGMFPSPKNRQCTSDLKRTPIEREVRRYLAANPQFGGLVVNCMGLRAQESASRKKLVTFKRSERNSKAGRTWFEWLPIHDWTVEQVFAAIAAAGQKPHWAYAAGASRIGCCFCIMGTDADKAVAARLEPVIYARICSAEIRHGHTLSMTRKTLPEITGIAPELELAA